ncbi:interleukin 17-like protein isoform X1 [Lytechinus pictus]|uniref:interleukin 17-like protein isoform X1 n=1 Tax=Lytechinus pictus TaxID=7653 RepID=UPI0030BA04A7
MTDTGRNVVGFCRSIVSSGLAMSFVLTLVNSNPSNRNDHSDLWAIPNAILHERRRSFDPTEEADALHQSFPVTANSLAGANTDCPSTELSSEECPDGANVTHPDHHNENSICPWTYIHCADPMRIPEVIAVAQCRCSTCLDPYTHRPDQNLVCQSITYKMKVLRRTPQASGQYRYHVATEDIPVACACLRKRTAVGKPGSDNSSSVVTEVVETIE